MNYLTIKAQWGHNSISFSFWSIFLNILNITDDGVSSFCEWQIIAKSSFVQWKLCLFKKMFGYFLSKLVSKISKLRSKSALKFKGYQEKQAPPQKKKISTVPCFFFFFSLVEVMLSSLSGLEWTNGTERNIQPKQFITAVKVLHGQGILSAKHTTDDNYSGCCNSFLQ